MLKKFAVVSTLCAIGVLVPAIANQTQMVAGYDFSYASSGDARAMPVQVFDGGSVTYFQFRAGDLIPAIFADVDGKIELIVPRFEGPYVVVDRVQGHYVLKLGRAQAHVVHTTGDRVDAPMIRQVAASGLETPYQGGRLMVGAKLVAQLPPVRANFTPDTELDHNSYAAPVKGDRVAWYDSTDEERNYSIPFAAGSVNVSATAAKLVKTMVPVLSTAQRIEIVGFDDAANTNGVAESRAAAVVNALAAAGVSRSLIFTKTSPQVKPGPKNGTEIGVTVVAYTSKPYTRAQNTPVAKAGSATLDQILLDLQGGRITPSQAKAAMEALKKGDAVAGAGASQQRWNVRLSDVTVSAMLKRWGTEAGWSVIDQGAPNIQIPTDRVLEKPDFLTAADYVISQAKAAGYQISAASYTNKVLVLSGKASK